MKKTLCIILASTLALGSCMSTQHNFNKRKYTKGWFHNKGGYRVQKGDEGGHDSNRVEHQEEVSHKIPFQESIVLNKKPPAQQEMSLVTENDVIPIPVIVPKEVIEETPCDIIMLKDGTDIESKVVEIGTDVIKYKKCDNESGPTYTVPRNDVFKIKYANGSSELISAIKQTQLTNSTLSQEQRTDKQQLGLILSIVGIVFGVVGLILIFFPIVSLIFGLISLIAGIMALRFAKDANNSNTVLIYKLGIWAITLGAFALLFAGVWLVLALF